jgi:hypothetical protein
LAAGQGAGRHAQGLGGSILDRPMFVPDQLAPADLPLGTQLQPGHELIFRPPRPEADVLSRVCEAVAMARICYRKKLPSFVVTATTVCLLRHYGEPAEMVIGAPQRPFEQHVWIEVGGSVVNQRPYARKKGFWEVALGWSANRNLPRARADCDNRTFYSRRCRAGQ